jgi:predicted outer membrane repeat protein
MQTQTQRHVRSVNQFVFAAALSAAWCSSAMAAQLLVPSQYSTIQAAINAASNGDEVVVADGTYSGTGFENMDFNGKAITVRSANGALNCILSYKGEVRAFHFHNGEGSNSVVAGFTIEGAFAYQEDGGAILCESAGPTIQDCIFLGNTATKGGAIASFYGDITVTDCHFEDNDASDGGAIYCEDDSSTISGCTFYGNNGSQTGGILIVDNYYSPLDATALISGCAFEANTSVDAGSAIKSDDCHSITIVDCTFDANNGAAVYNSGGDVAIEGCAFSDNQDFNWGGAIFSGYGASVTIDDCRFADNSGGKGGAVSNIGPYLETPTLVQVTDCVFAGNAAENAGGAIYNWRGAVSTIRRCQFIDNSAAYEGGGGIFIGTASDVKVANCFFAGNSARLGGAICNLDDDDSDQIYYPLIVNCVLTGNDAYYGGGIYNERIDPLIANCTLSANRGGAVYNTTGTAPTITNSILWNNLVAITGGSPTVTYSNVQGGFAGIGNINADPLFADYNGPDNVLGTEDDDLHLLTLSPCINAGSNAAIPADAADVDLDGNLTEQTPLDLDLNSRVVNVTVDIGAYEKQ